VLLNTNFLLFLKSNVARYFLENIVDYKKEKRSQRPSVFELGYEAGVRELGGP
jgi:hypothetical protein